jgi:hypothetical protein
MPLLFAILGALAGLVLSLVLARLATSSMGEEPEPQALDLTPEQLAAFRDGLARRESALHVRGGIWVIAHALLIASLFLAIGRTPTALLLITLFIALGIAAMWAVTAQASRRRLDSAYRALEDHDAVYRAFIAAGGERASLISDAALVWIPRLFVVFWTAAIVSDVHARHSRPNRTPAFAGSSRSTRRARSQG